MGPPAGPSNAPAASGAQRPAKQSSQLKAIAAIAAIAVGGYFVTKDDGSPSSTTSQPPGASGTTGKSDKGSASAAAIIGNLAEWFSDDSPLTQSQAECMASGTYDALGEAALIAIGEDRDPGAIESSLTQAQATKVVDVAFKCADMTAIFMKQVDSESGTSAQKSCMKKALNANLVREIAIAALMRDEPPPSKALLAFYDCEGK